MQPTNGSDSNQPPQQQLSQQEQRWLHYQQLWNRSMGQYPAAAAAMEMDQQKLMMYRQQYLSNVNQAHPHQYQPPLQQALYQNQLGSGGTPEGPEFKTLWIGNLQDWMDEGYLHNCFAQAGEVASVKVIRSKQTGRSEGYGFVEFALRAVAEKVLKSYTGLAMPGTNQRYCIHWTSRGSDLTVFVGDLAPDVTDMILRQTFANRYISVEGAKVVVDFNSGHSKGYGFVRFSNENERARAITEMNGIYCLSRPMRVAAATPKKSAGFEQQQYPSQGSRSNGPVHQASQYGNDPTNTTIFVGGIGSETTDADLRHPFSQFGDVLSIRIPIGKGCAFVQFATRSGAEAAIEGYNGTVMGKCVRLSWAWSQANRQSGGGQSHPVQHNQDQLMNTSAHHTSYQEAGPSHPEYHRS